MTDQPSSKRSKGNPPGEDCQLHEDGTVTRDEDTIIRVQQIFKDFYYRPGGKWFKQHLKNYGDEIVLKNSTTS
jgi:hypothetical protein